MTTPTLHPAIEHLSPADIDTVIERYVAGEKISALISRFNIKCPPNGLWKVLPPRVLPEICSVCGGTMIQEWKSHMRGKPFWIHCSLCLHQNTEECGCDHCREQRALRAEEENARRAAETFKAVVAQRERNPRLIDSISSLSLPLAVAFLAFSRCSQVIDDGVYGRLDDCPVPYAPDGEYKMTLLNSLCRAGLVSLSGYSAIGTISYEGLRLSYISDEVHWSGDVNENIKLVKEIEACGLTGNWPADWHGEVESVWLQLAMGECREFYDSCRTQRELASESDQVISGMLQNILRDFSVGQCFRIIWQGAESALNIARNCGTFTSEMVRSCQQWADEARSQKYPVKPLKRHRRRSMMSYVLFDVMLKIGERGFTDVILSAPDYDQA